MAVVTIRRAHRDVKCRLCERTAPKGTEMVVFDRVHVSPKRVQLMFHRECLADAAVAAGWKERS